MRRIRHRHGTLTVQHVPTPAPGPGELLVRTEAIGVTLPVVRKLAPHGGAADGPVDEVVDEVVDEGDDGAEPEPLGGEVAGVVEAVGPDVAEATGFAPGDRVTGLCFGDAYSDAALLHTAMASAVPDHATAHDAVALVRGGLVALGALEAAHPRPGETALVTAAASGAGHLALQLARLRGGAGHVVAAVGDPAAKGDFLRALGADAVVGYGDTDWGPPADYALDAVGGALLGPLVRGLTDGGRLVAYSSGGGTLAAHELLAGATSVTGFQIGRVARERPALYAAWREELWRLHAAGELRPAVAAAFPLAEAARAHALIRARGNLGKVVLEP